MDHPLIGNERPGPSRRRDFAAARRAAYVPELAREPSASSSERLERHLAALAPASTATATRPAPTQRDVAQATALLREITPRSGTAVTSQGPRRFSLLAPLRSVRRWFGF
ncbi:hypothetical protein [Actinospica durhamensis]|jgi:hypothetical protein|nr:hypothetical protein [Actinospica durhamensis]